MSPVCLFCHHLPWFLHCPGTRLSAGACPQCATHRIRPPEKDPSSYVLVGVNYSSPSSPEKRNKAQPVAHVIVPGRRGFCLRHKPSSLLRQGNYKPPEPAALSEQTSAPLTPLLMGAPRPLPRWKAPFPLCLWLPTLKSLKHRSSGVPSMGTAGWRARGFGRGRSPQPCAQHPLHGSELFSKMLLNQRRKHQVGFLLASLTRLQKQSLHSKSFSFSKLIRLQITASDFSSPARSLKRRETFCPRTGIPGHSHGSESRGSLAGARGLGSSDSRGFSAESSSSLQRVDPALFSHQLLDLGS